MKTKALTWAIGAMLGLLLSACTEQTFSKIDVAGGDGQQEFTGDVDASNDSDILPPDAVKDQIGADLDAVHPDADVHIDGVEKDLGDACCSPDADVGPDVKVDAPVDVLPDVLPDAEVVTPPILGQVGWFSGAVSTLSGTGALQVIGGFGINGSAVHP